jgi:phage baseplate assembly protein W
MARQDFAFPFHIASASGRAAEAAYQDHVEQMIRQVLLTDPGERVCLPEFGAGLRRLLFAPASSQIEASAKLIVTQALNRWLGDQITVRNVAVRTSDDRTSPGDASGALLPEGAVMIEVQYVVIETQSIKTTEVKVF